MRAIILALGLVLTGGTAMADCAAMWVTRNMVFDRAGYCFGSTLGQSVFSNAGCIGTDVDLPSRARDFVAHTRSMEAVFDCKIDTGRSSLDLPLLNTWLKLDDLPRQDEFGSGCIGWTGPRTPLRDGHWNESRVIGTLMQGDVVLLMHWPYEDWNFVTVTRGGREAELGWTDAPFGPDTCERLAG